MLYPLEICAQVRSHEEWKNWAKEHQFIFSPEHSQQVIAQIREYGVTDPLSGEITVPADVKILHDNYRETIRTEKLISRHRGVLMELKRLATDGPEHLLSRQCKCYAPEALTDFALYLRGLYPRFVGSEYAETDADRQSLWPILAEDLTALSFGNHAFDLVLSNDVFEHVPDLDKALQEIARILNNQGVLISTFPFAFGREKGVVKAKRVGTQIEYLMQPEYHGNPMKPNEGSLVFEIPGWDLIERARLAGFDDAYFSFICSARHGVVGKDINGVFVFVATKQPMSIKSPDEPRDTAADHTTTQFDSPVPMVASVVGLPRSGTTVFAAAVGAHPAVKAVFEPWNAEKKHLPPTNLGLKDFIDQFGVKLSGQQRVLFVKETAADLAYLGAIDALLADPSGPEPSRLIWLYRDPLHAFLSEVNARKDWWGEPGLEATADTFSKWALRSLQAVRKISSMGVHHQTLCVEYGAFVMNPAETLKIVMPFLGLDFRSDQLEYFKTVNKNDVRGDINVAENPKAISNESTVKRMTEANGLTKSIAKTKYFSEIEAIRDVALRTITGRQPSRDGTLEFLKQITAALGNHP